MTTRQMTLLGVGAITLILIDLFYFSQSSFVFFFLGSFLVYVGLTKYRKLSLYSGLAMLLLTSFSMWSLRFIIIVFVLWVVTHLMRGETTEHLFRPLREKVSETPNGIWKNKWFSFQASPFTSYEWEDVHATSFYGDMTIDVTQTVLPKSTSFISVRQSFGKVKVIVPYEIPVRIHFSSLLGEAKLFDYEKQRLVNETLQMKDLYDGKRTDSAQLIISVYVAFGDLEVIRK